MPQDRQTNSPEKIDLFTIHLIDCLVDCVVVICKLTEELFMTLLHVCSKTEARVENLLANVTLEICVKLSVEFMLVLHTAIHVAESLITLVTC